MRSDVPTWDEYFLGFASLASKRSKDSSTQVGAVIVDSDNHIVATGYNGFAPGVNENYGLWQRPVKYDRVIHAEMNAIAHAAKKGTPVGGCTMYVTHFPCNKAGCARMIIASGIRKLVSGPCVKGWDDDHIMSKKLFEEAGLEVAIYEQDTSI